MPEDSPYPGFYQDLAQHFPLYLKRVLILSGKPEPIAAVLRDQEVSDLVVGEESPQASTPFDGLVLQLESSDTLALDAKLAALAPFLDAHTRLFVVLANPAFYRNQEPGNAADLDAAHAALDRSGWRLYACIAQLDPQFEEAAPEPISEVAHQQLACATYVLVGVRAQYNPQVHAASLFDGGDPAGSFHVLNTIPEDWVSDAVMRYGIELEKHLSLMAWAQQAPPERQIYLFARSQQYFFFLAYNRPDHPTGYQCQAAFWTLLNRTDMAARTLQSYLDVYPDAGVAQQLRRLPRRRAGVETMEALPLAHGLDACPPKMLLIMPPRPHFGLDVLFDGLCRLLGAANVSEFPRKPSLHGERPEQYANYPCLFDYPDQDWNEEELLDALRGGLFDYVLWGDCEQILPQAMSRALSEAAGDTPFFILDAVDECCSFQARTLEYLGRPAADAYFKREMLAGWDYGPNAFPMPFAYPDGLVGDMPVAERSLDFFWAGHRFSGLRRLYLERLEAILDRRLDARYEQEEYSRCLREARIGLNLFGYGFDTVRYWELPAHGAMLLSERLPLQIPFNFEDGVSAVFFDDTADLERKALHYLKHRDEAAAIAAAGHRHLVAHHTGSARAAQVLGCIQRYAR